MVTTPTIYVVDDDQSVRDSLRAVLGIHDLCADLYSDAEQFLGTLDFVEHGCVVLDINLPTMDGFGVIEALRQRGAVLPVILITGRVDQKLKDKAAAAGAIG